MVRIESTPASDRLFVGEMFRDPEVRGKFAEHREMALLIEVQGVGVAAAEPLIAVGRLQRGNLLFHPGGIVVADDAAGFAPEPDDGIDEGADHAAFARPRFALLRVRRQRR